MKLLLLLTLCFNPVGTFNFTSNYFCNPDYFGDKLEIQSCRPIIDCNSSNWDEPYIDRCPAAI